jgi:hypothetical protein
VLFVLKGKREICERFGFVTLLSVSAGQVVIVQGILGIISNRTLQESYVIPFDSVALPKLRSF